MSIDDVISRMGKVRIRDRTTSSQRLTAAHHRDDHMIFEMYTPSVHGTIEQFLQKYDVKKMMNQAFIVESASFRDEYNEWKAKQDEKQVNEFSHDKKETSTPSILTLTSISTSTATDTKERTDAKSSSSFTSTSTCTSTAPSTSIQNETNNKQIHVRTVKYQRLYDIMGTNWEGLKNEWIQKCDEWNDAHINQRSSILNANVLDTMANKYQCKSGRWMFFLTMEHDVAGIWKRCAEACNKGVLGPHVEISRSSAQSSTVTAAGENWKLGIWTWDYTDVHDCERVLKEIKKFIPNVNAKTCSYKSKISSFLEILSKNEWKLPYKMHDHLLSQPSSRRRY